VSQGKGFVPDQVVMVWLGTGLIPAIMAGQLTFGIDTDSGMLLAAVVYVVPLAILGLLRRR